MNGGNQVNKKEERHKSLIGDIVEGQVNSLILPTAIAITIIVAVILIWHFSRK